MADVRISAEWCEAEAAAWSRKAAVYRLAALALRYAELRPKVERSLRCGPEDWNWMVDELDKAQSALLAYANEVSRPSAAEEDGR